MDEKKNDKFIIDDTMKDNSCNSNSKVTTAAATTTTNVSMDNDAAAADADETMKDNRSYSNSKVTTATITDMSVVDNDATADAVIMYSLKVSSNNLQCMIHTLPTDTAIMGGTLPSTWVVKARQLFLGRLSLLMNKKHDDDIAAADEESLEDCIALSENETAIMKLIIELAS